MAANGHERRRASRHAETLRLRFQFAGRPHIAITTDVSPHGAMLVAPVRLPPGAIMLFHVEGRSGAASDGADVRLIAQVVWSGPAPFGGEDAYAAGVQLMRASASSWESLLGFLEGDLHSAGSARGRSQEQRGAAIVDLRAEPDAHGVFEVLFFHDGVWYRGGIVTANAGTVWVRSAGIQLPRGTPVRLQIAVSDAGRRTALSVSGRVPGDPIPDPRSRGWVFEVDVDELSHPDLYHRLLQRLGRAGDSGGARSNDAR